MFTSKWQTGENTPRAVMTFGAALATESFKKPSFSTKLKAQTHKNTPTVLMNYKLFLYLLNSPSQDILSFHDHPFRETLIFIPGINGNSLGAGFAEHCGQIYSLLHIKAPKKTPYSHFKDGKSKYKIVVQNSRRNLDQPGHNSSAGLCKGLTFPVPRE